MDKEVTAEEEEERDFFSRVKVCLKFGSSKYMELFVLLFFVSSFPFRRFRICGRKQSKRKHYDLSPQRKLSLSLSRSISCLDFISSPESSKLTTSSNLQQD